MADCRQDPDGHGESSRKRDVSLSLVIPVYNEQAILPATVGAVVDALRDDDALHGFEILVSENGSNDGTRAVARKLAARYDEVVVLESDVPDYGAAMRDGFRTAGGTFIANFDADYYDMEFLRRALEIDADIVIAAKGMAGSVDTRALLRRSVSRSYGLLVRHLLDLRTTETHGMKLFRRAAIAPLLPQVWATKDLFDTELVALAEKSGLTIVELPIKTAEMRHSRSAILRRIPRTVWGLVKMRQRFRRADRSGPLWLGEEWERPPGVAALQDDHLGEDGRLFVIRRGGVAIGGVEEALIALDRAGVAVVLVVLEEAIIGTGAQIRDELDRIAELSPARMGGSGHGTRAEGEALADAHASFFALADTARPALNRDQRAVLLVRQPPDAAAWQELTVELGSRLTGVYALDGEEVVPLEAPGRSREGTGARWLAWATLVAGVLLLLGGAILLALQGTLLAVHGSEQGPQVTAELAVTAL